jgi:hypothetical protein
MLYGKAEPGTCYGVGVGEGAWDSRWTEFALKWAVDLQAVGFLARVLRHADVGYGFQKLKVALGQVVSSVWEWKVVRRGVGTGLVLLERRQALCT